MPYHELIKNFERIRDYMREFYIYGFKSREQYDKKSSRSYDNERRRVESWLGNYMQFYRTSQGKKFFLSIDSRSTQKNPLYKAWKTCSFTDKDITLHFIIFDILYSGDISMSINEITEKIYDEYLSCFEFPIFFDESTIRKKLKEYETQGLLSCHKNGKTILYSRNKDYPINNIDMLHFFSEVAPCGVIGSFILDKMNDQYDYCFTFKHHYIFQALDSDILCSLFYAMHQKREVKIRNIIRKNKNITELTVVPLKILISSQSGRQYLLGYKRSSKRITSFRLDYILNVTLENFADDFDILRKKFQSMSQFLWGISTQSHSGKRKESIEFTIKYSDNEQYIYHRLEREKRCGQVELIDHNKCRFYAEVYDSNELLPWIRTFICRITDIKFSNKKVEEQFFSDINKMYEIYDLK